MVGWYVNSNRGNDGNNVVPRYSALLLEDSDVAYLQSIIAMMQQMIDQSNRKKDLLEQRLSTEQDRSQMKLHAFAWTVEGVDGQRKSAEVMEREICMIKVRGYWPMRSDLLGGGGGISMMNNADDGGLLMTAVEASDNMEEAIRLIESQNDAMEERRRMGVVVMRAVASTTTLTSSTSSTKKESGTLSWGALGVLDPDREGGFLSFWDNANSRNGRRDNEKEDGGDNNTNGGTSKEKKKKSKRKHKRRDEGGDSVLTSCFYRS